MPAHIHLRELEDIDLDTLFVQQIDPQANLMAAFTVQDPTDRAAFNAHWVRIRADASIVLRVIDADGAVAGSVSSYGDDGSIEITYWLGRAFWGLGIASQAVALFLDEVQRVRPIAARVAHDNLGSLRVLQNNGFVVVAEERGFANARNAEIGELVLRLG